MAVAPEAIGVYIFAGGFSLGVKAAGWKILAHLEEGQFGVNTARNLLPEVRNRIWVDRHTWPLGKFRDIPFVYANPPCAVWSVAGRSMTEGRTSWMKDNRTDCIKNLMGVLRDVRPAVLCWESVTMAWVRGRSLVRQLEREARTLGYHSRYLLTGAELHGIPQPRHRFLMFMTRVELDFPKPTTPYRDVQEVLGITYDEQTGVFDQVCPVWGIPTTHRGYFWAMSSMYPGEGMRECVTEIGAFGRGEGEIAPPFMAHRLTLKGRGKTFTSAAFEVHPTQPRWIANSEVAALGGWPYGYADEKLYVGDQGEVRAHLTKAVMPPVGEYVGRMVREALEKGTTPAGEARVVSHIEDERPGLTEA